MSSSGRKPAPQAPTEAAMRSLHGPTREEQEELKTGGEEDES